MFMPQSQPHLARSHGAPGTARRGARDKENAGALPSKTPVRAPLGKAGPSTAGRALGARTVDRNIQAQQPNEDLAPKRLFQNVDGKNAKSEKAGPSQPLRVKTPGPNRATRTPAPRNHNHMRTPGPQLRLYHDEPTPAPLPSAQRTRRRSRASLQSPVHHEEADLSLDSIMEADVDVETAATADEDDFELEYAPPTAIDRPYVPEWADSIPDPVKTMSSLANIRPMALRLPPSPPGDFTDIPLPKVQLCDDDELNHPLLRKKVKGRENGKDKENQPTIKGAAMRVGPRPATAVGTVRSRSNASSLSHTTSTSGAAAPSKRPLTTMALMREPSSGTARPHIRTASSASSLRTGATSTAGARSATSGSATRPVRPATSTAVRSTVSRTSAGTSSSTVRPSTATAVRSTARPGTISSSVRPASRVTSATLVRPAVLSGTSSTTTTARPATAATTRRPAVPTTSSTARPATASATGRPVKPSRVAPVPSRDVSKPRTGVRAASAAVSCSPPPPTSPGPSMPAVIADNLDLNFGDLSDLAPVEPASNSVANSALCLASPTSPTAGSGNEKVVAPPTPTIAVSLQPTQPVESEKGEAGADQPHTETASAASPKPVLTPNLVLPAATFDAATPSPLMSPRLPGSPLMSDAFDFAALTAALPPIDTQPPTPGKVSTPQEDIEMLDLHVQDESNDIPTNTEAAGTEPAASSAGAPPATDCAPNGLGLAGAEANDATQSAVAPEADEATPTPDLVPVVAAIQLTATPEPDGEFAAAADIAALSISPSPSPLASPCEELTLFPNLDEPLQFTGRRLARISERTELPTFIDESFDADESFDRI